MFYNLKYSPGLYCSQYSNILTDIFLINSEICCYCSGILSFCKDNCFNAFLQQKQLIVS